MTNKPGPKIFQSYLFVGSQSQTAEEIEKFLKTQNIGTSNASPDITTITAQKKSITIEQIRNLKSQIYQKPLLQKFKIIIVQDGDTLTKEAQNALLKIYEEPPSHAVIILTAQNIKSLLPTIRSRAVVKLAKRQETRQEPALPKNTVSLLNAITDVEDPQKWLNNQMENYFALLNESINKRNSTKKYLKILEKLRDAKKMVSQNVNPKFVLFDLALYIGS